jgi:copper chaperone
MIAFRIDDMTCGHCVQTITQAVKGADAGAILRIDLASHRVEIDSTKVDARRLQDAIAGAGYTPVPA